MGLITIRIRQNKKVIVKIIIIKAVSVDQAHEAVDGSTDQNYRREEVKAVKRRRRRKGKLGASWEVSW